MLLLFHICDLPELIQASLLAGWLLHNITPLVIMSPEGDGEAARLMRSGDRHKVMSSDTERRLRRCTS